MATPAENVLSLIGLYYISMSILVLKIMGLIVLTVYKRMMAKVFISEEDAKFFKGEVKLEEDIERIRRAVQNDLENIIPFLIVSYFYIYTQPSVRLAYFLIIVFVIVRIGHSLVYAVFVAPQPTRAVLWAIGFTVTAVMAIFNLIDGFSKINKRV